ncbi:nucleoside-diphosphate kinase [Aquibium microcysteis]|uniref:nucleoside-diphosphate kinase n=1 Tax=Aquibium microcysteis TaxID=675281 RepID=UPI00165CFFD1|nr:nucleoside-diphosphate kinase [Aquibium microcysteis]
MSKETCILTTKDYTILEVMRDRCLGQGDPMAPILKRKIESAIVMFRDEVPDDVATMSSRVTFSVNGRDPDTRIISHDRMTSMVGMFLPVTTLRGLALLGLAEGEHFVLTGSDGVEERILLEKIQYQPEAARREKESLQRHSVRQAPGKPSLRLIRGAFYDRAPLVAASPDGVDDPGPSAA